MPVTHERNDDPSAAAFASPAGPEALATASDSPIRVAALERAVLSRDRRIEVMQQRLDVLEASTSMAVGRVLVGAARNPGRGIWGLPRELYGVWRHRGGTVRAAGAPVDGTARAAPARFEGEDAVFALDRLLAHTAVTVSPRAVPVIAGVLTASTADTLRGPAAFPRAVVNTLLPHDAQALLTGTDPDVLLIEARALEAPGPWAHATQGTLVNRDLALHQVTTGARAAGRPVVVWWSAPRHRVPGLARLASQAAASLSCADWHPGSDPPADCARLPEWFRSDAPPVRLDELCVRLGLRFDPLAARRVAVVAQPGQPWLPAALIGQEHRPARVVLTPGSLEPAACTELADLGVEVVRTALPAEAVDAAALGDCAFLARWSRPDPPPPGWLIGLLAAVEARGADAAAPLARAGHRDGEPVEIEPLLAVDTTVALVRCSLALGGVQPDRWAAHGARLLGVPASVLDGSRS